MSEEKEIERKAGDSLEGEEALLLPIESLLSAGIHIGTRIKKKTMDPFIYRVRSDGLFVLDVKQTDERIRMAAKFVAKFEPSKVVAVSSRLYGQTPVKQFCEQIGAVPISGRFLPGLFSNPNHSSHLEAGLVIVTDPRADRQAVKEASLAGIPVIALCDTDNDFSEIDLVIPINNKGRRALATVYWLLARQTLRERGDLASDEDLSASIDSFETKLVESQELLSE